MIINSSLILSAFIFAIVLLQPQNAFAQSTNPYGAEAKQQGERPPSGERGSDSRFPSQISSNRIITGSRILTRKERSKIALKKAESFLNSETPNYEQAVYWLESAVEGNPKSEKAYLLLGSVYTHLELFKSAVSAYQEALSLDEKSFDALVGLGKSNFYLRSFNAAIDYYQKAVVTNSTDYTANVMLANSYFMQKRFEQAAESYRKTLQIDSKSVEAHYNLALCYFNLNNRSEAIKQIELLKNLNVQASEKLEKIINN